MKVYRRQCIWLLIQCTEHRLNCMVYTYGLLNLQRTLHRMMLSKQILVSRQLNTQYNQWINLLCILRKNYHKTSMQNWCLSIRQFSSWIGKQNSIMSMEIDNLNSCYKQILNKLHSWHCRLHKLQLYHLCRFRQHKLRCRHYCKCNKCLNTQNRLRHLNRHRNCQNNECKFDLIQSMQLDKD